MLVSADQPVTLAPEVAFLADSSYVVVLAVSVAVVVVF